MKAFRIGKPGSWIVGLLAVCLTATASAATPKVLLIGVDGLRGDVLVKASTPHLDALRLGGASTLQAQIQGPYQKSDTASGPGWSSILTGVWADKHGVHDNSFLGKNFAAYPMIFHRLRNVRPGAQTAALVSWPEIDHHIISDATVRVVEGLPPGSASPVGLYGYGGRVGIETRDGAWHHVLGQRAGGIIALYLDGKKVAEVADATGAFHPEGSVYFIGRDARENGPGFRDGEIGTIRMWDRALSPEEIGRLATNRERLPADWEKAELLAETQGVPAGGRVMVPVRGGLEPRAEGDFAVEAWFRTTDPGRNILVSNFLKKEGGAALTLELTDKNSARLYLQPAGSIEERLKWQEQMDAQVAAKAAERIRSANDEMVFAYFHECDAAGHGLGFESGVPAYVKAIEHVDLRVGELLEAVRSRPNFHEEDWLIVICTDHGGRKRSHADGQNVPEIREVPLILNGGGFESGSSLESASLVDIAPTILAHLGVPVRDLALDGKPLRGVPAAPQP